MSRRRAPVRAVVFLLLASSLLAGSASAGPLPELDVTAGLRPVAASRAAASAEARPAGRAALVLFVAGSRAAHSMVGTS